MYILLKFCLEGLLVLSLTLYCLFPCLFSSHEISLYFFYLKEFLSHYKFTPFACLIVKYRGHECNIDMPVPPPCCLWVVQLSRLTAVGPSSFTWALLVGHYQPLTIVGVGPLPVLFGPVLCDPGGPCVLLNLLVLWVTLLRG